MKILIKIVQGEGCVMTVNEHTKISEIKQHVQAQLKVPVVQQSLILFGKTLVDEQTVSYYPKIKDGTKIHLIVKKPESLEIVMRRFLQTYYTEKQTQLIVAEFMEDFHRTVGGLSLDDLERIATSCLTEENV